MEFNELLKNRRSIRKYKTDKVSDEQIHEIIEAAIYAPSWKNSQVARYYVVKSDEMLETIKGTLPNSSAFNNKFI